jgi:2-dehydro-3-deoxyphosphogluconate aldolase/(4S)-4-hydroxy-2-oxoglutarate aldolase
VDVIQRIGEIKIVPVVAIDNAARAADLAAALIEGGIPCAEITFRTSAAIAAIESMSTRFSDMLVGAGSVLDMGQAKSAVTAGARFIVSPGFSPEVVRWCLDNAIPVIPGIATPTELGTARRERLEVVKFFPAEILGGVKGLKAISAPFPDMRFIPTGGIHLGNLAEYLELRIVHACGASWMVERSLISDGNFDEIVRRAKAASGVATAR